jgi:hypothetical protein
MDKETIESKRRPSDKKPVLRTPRILRIVGEESMKNGTDRMSSREIDQIIQSVRAERRKPR